LAAERDQVAGTEAFCRGRRRSIRWLALLPATMIGGCGVLPSLNLKSPKLSVADFEFTDIGLDQIGFNLTVLADNPNDSDITLNNLKFDLDIWDLPFTSGVAREAALTLPARASKRIPIEFKVSTARLIDLVKSARNRDPMTLNYRLKGSATWGSWGWPVSFERSGDLKVLRRLIDLLGALI
jgi:LEA14-like dessication related protein